jgi:hypothetical protein
LTHGLTGTFENGESRLLFSSQQVEYIRYWLHAVGFTETLLPLPSTSYLLTETSLKAASPVTYKSGAELKAAVKVKDKSQSQYQPLAISVCRISPRITSV